MKNIIFVLLLLISITSVAAVPAAPTNLTVSEITATTFKANWDTPTDVISYWMDLSTSPTFTTGNVFIDRHVHRGEVTEGLTVGTTYYFRVRCANASGTSANSAIKSVTPTLLPPTNLTVVSVVPQDVNKMALTYSFSPSAMATSYKLDFSTSSDFQSGNILTNQSVSNATNQMVFNLTPGTAYYFRLRATNGVVTSANSVIKSLVTPPAAPVVYALRAIGTTFMHFQWAPSQGANGYRYDISRDYNADYIIQNGDAGPRTDLLIQNLEPGKFYYFKVRAVNNLGTSESGGINDWTGALNVPVPVATEATNVTPLSFTMNWTVDHELSNIVFLYEVATDPEFKGIIRRGSATNLDHASINFTTPPGTCYYRLRTHIGFDYSGYSNTITVGAVNLSAQTSEDLNVYPNPVRSSELLNVNLKDLAPDTDLKAIVTDQNGNVQHTYNLRTDKAGVVNSGIPVSSLKPGTYILKANDKSYRFVVE